MAELSCQLQVRPPPNRPAPPARASRVTATRKLHALTPQMANELRLCFNRSCEWTLRFGWSTCLLVCKPRFPTRTYPRACIAHFTPERCPASTPAIPLASALQQTSMSWYRAAIRGASIDLCMYARDEASGLGYAATISIQNAHSRPAHCSTTH